MRRSFLSTDTVTTIKTSLLHRLRQTVEHARERRIQGNHSMLGRDYWLGQARDAARAYREMRRLS